MTPQQKAKARQIAFKWFLTPTAVLGAAGFGARQVDALYVHDRAFTAYKDTLSRKAMRDSMSYVVDMKEVRRILSGLDSSDRCQRGQSVFCR